ncbi:MAG: hypothetical protein HYZ81_00555, partial [Nitrospinae bacterium]|nr:hypothetical protein [Nitrospinota bacterium]
MGLLTFFRRLVSQHPPLAASTPASPRPAFTPIGQVDAICPTCHQPLAKKPGRKTQCPHRDAFMYVRTPPLDRQKVLVTEAQIQQIEEQWAIVDGRHGQYLGERQAYEAMRAQLAKSFGREPPENDVKFALLNQQLIEHSLQGNWGLYRNARWQMAEILRKEGRAKGTLAIYLEILYLDLNGPRNTSGVIDPSFLREFPPFDRRQAMVAPGILHEVSRLLEQLRLGPEEVFAIFRQ